MDQGIQSFCQDIRSPVVLDWQPGLGRRPQLGRHRSAGRHRRGERLVGSSTDSSTTTREGVLDEVEGSIEQVGVNELALISALKSAL